jgi:hypothetical protein
MEKRKQSKIVRELPSVGTKLERTFFGKKYSAKIVRDKNVSDGRIIELDGMKFTSMTAAAQAITKQPTNGWRFWKIRD